MDGIAQWTVLFTVVTHLVYLPSSQSDSDLRLKIDTPAILQYITHIRDFHAWNKILCMPWIGVYHGDRMDVTIFFISRPGGLTHEKV